MLPITTNRTPWGRTPRLLQVFFASRVAVVMARRNTHPYPCLRRGYLGEGREVAWKSRKEAVSRVEIIAEF